MLPEGEGMSIFDASVKYAERGVPLVEMNLLSSYVVVIKYLNKVGLSGQTDPFVCPMVAQLRPRY